MQTYAGVDGQRGELSPERMSRLERELERGERVVWAVSPSPRAYARGSWGVCLFGAVFGGFAVFWMVMAGFEAWFSGNATGAQGVFAFFPLCGLPFLAVGVAMLTTPVWMRGRAAKVIYAVTDRRALVITPVTFRGESVRTFLPSQLGSLERVERSDGSGDLIFTRDPYMRSDSDGNTTRGYRGVGFIGVGDVRGAERVVRRLVAAVGATAGGAGD